MTFEKEAGVLDQSPFPRATGKDEEVDTKIKESFMMEEEILSQHSQMF